jgi:cell division septation protein DedD
MTPVTKKVPADSEEWVDSGVEIIKGKSYKITASGKWTINARRCGWSGPDGKGEFCTRSGQAFPQALDAPYSVLIGKIGETNPFIIGNGIDLTADKSGKLLLRSNDAEGGFFNNEGKIEVKVTLLSGQPTTVAKETPSPTATPSAVSVQKPPPTVTTTPTPTTTATTTPTPPVSTGDIKELERKLEYLKEKQKLDAELQLIQAKLKELNKKYSDVK